MRCLSPSAVSREFPQVQPHRSCPERFRLRRVVVLLECRSQPPDQRIVATIGIYETHLAATLTAAKPQLWKEKSDLRETLLWYVAVSHWIVKESTLVNQSTQGKGGQRWSNRLFYTKFGRWFLYRNPKWPRKGKNRLAAVHRRPNYF